MEKYLVVKACAGIGNRLYTVARAIEIALQQGRTLVVDWADGQFAPKGFNAFYHFFELVDLPHRECVLDNKDESIYPLAWKNELGSAIYDKFYVVEPPLEFLRKIPLRFLPGTRLKMLGGYWTSCEIKNTANLRGFVSNMFSQHSFPYGEFYYRNRNEDILVYVEFSPGFKPDLLLRHIRLKKQLVEKAKAFRVLNGLAGRSVGIHIRATDKQPLRATDQLADHLSKQTGRAEKLFLATDNIKVEQVFREKFGKRLLVYPKFLPDTEGDGLHQYALYKNDESIMLQMTEESLMDMYILSTCETLYYQGNSSFSDIARIWHGSGDKCFDWFNVSLKNQRYAQ